MKRIIFLRAVLLILFLSTVLSSSYAQILDEFKYISGIPTKGAVVSYQEDIYTEEMKFGEWTREETPSRSLVFYPYNDGRIGTIYNRLTDEYFQQEYDESKRIITKCYLDGEKDVYSYEGSRLKSVSRYNKSGRLDEKDIYRNENGLTFRSSYNDDGWELYKTLVLKEGEESRLKKFKDIPVDIFRNENIIRRIDVKKEEVVNLKGEKKYIPKQYDSEVYSYGKGNLLQKKVSFSSTGEEVLSWQFSYTFNDRGDWVECMKTYGSDNVRFVHKRTITYSDNPAFAYIDPEKVAAARKKEIRDSLEKVKFIKVEEQRREMERQKEEQRLKEQAEREERLRENERIRTEEEIRRREKIFNDNMGWITHTKGTVEKASIDDQGRITFGFSSIPATSYPKAVDVQAPSSVYGHKCFQGADADSYLLFYMSGSSIIEAYVLVNAHEQNSAFSYAISGKALSVLNKYYKTR